MKSPMFKQLMQAISYGKFQNLVKKYGGGRYSKNFSSWNHLQLMIYFQLAGRTSIRDVINSLKSKIKDLYHNGLIIPSRNNLSQENSKRDYRIFKETFYSLKTETTEKSIFTVKNEFKFKMPVKSFDSVSLRKSMCKCAKFRKNKSGIKFQMNETQSMLFQ